ncbi:DUF802 domain-containing protein [Xanthomonas sacchari]|uniref:DUF802 domain-containing protein n=1 Tax=Xanthomonas sacchari TaxID=56458 RepID=UPI00225E14E4|nr:DUF802 domain-containing protein [Xanthomonas sacchari]UYK81716.1 DUF802 domain-containing protein [Xanthomonas sacchari]
MPKTLLHSVLFLAGLAVVCWIGVGYLGSNPLGASFAALIGLCYLAGIAELYRYRQATATLQTALSEAESARDDLGGWLQRLHPSLRNAVRLRIEGERAALTVPALTPYLVGLLVLLGMLGTFLGMMATLRGTGLALDSATDLNAIRASLAAPLKGLGFAFGTSIAGVAASAMLGLLAALCRRERLQAVQHLDLHAATALRTHSLAYQRNEAFKLLQTQATLMPGLIERMQTMMAALEQHSAVSGERLVSSQDAFHSRTEAAYTRLAGAVEHALQAGVAAHARAFGDALEPVVQRTLDGVARETAALQDSVGQAVQRQLDGLASGFAQAAEQATQRWDSALAEQQRINGALLQELGSALQRAGDGLEQRATTLVEATAARLQAASDDARQAWTEAMAQQREANDGLAARQAQALDAVASRLDATAEAAQQAWSTALEQQREANAALVARNAQALDTVATRLNATAETAQQGWDAALAQQRAINDTLATHTTQALETVATRLDATVEAVQQAWSAALAQQREVNEALATRNAQALDTAAASLEQRAAALAETLQQAHADLQEALEARDQARLRAWTDSFASMAATLGGQWEHHGERIAQRQQEICSTLQETAAAMSEQGQAQARDTIAEIERLVQVASEAPKAAADVVAELRQKLSDSMVRDTAMLDERNRLLATLQTLLEAVNHASTEQRSAVDALVATSADLLERVGSRFTDQIDAQTGKLDDAAAQVVAGVTEVVSLGDAFSGAVQAFGESNAALLERLQGIEQALDKSLTRSDEQLAYYVAQAREVIDLSMLSQQQITEELRQLAARQAPDQADAA